MPSWLNISFWKALFILLGFEGCRGEHGGTMAAAPFSTLSKGSARLALSLTASIVQGMAVRCSMKCKKQPLTVFGGCVDVIPSGQHGATAGHQERKEFPI